MQQREILEAGGYYHVYTHGVGNCDLFSKPVDYMQFLHLYDRYIDPIAETFAWCLMPNHLHALVRIKSNICYRFTSSDVDMDASGFKEVKWQTVDLSAFEEPDSVKVPIPEKHFSHLFNAYARYFNMRNHMKGVLFERSFKRKQIKNHKYFKNVVLYIHNNPVHHGFCSHPLEYPWTSYLSCISIKPTHLQREAVIGWFDNEANFKLQHNQSIDVHAMNNFLNL